MRFHVVGLPHTHVTNEFSSCAFTQRVRKFCSLMMGLGHEVFLYAGPKSDAIVTEFIPCLSEESRLEAVGDRHYTEASFDNRHAHWEDFLGEVIFTMTARIQEKDFICIIGGIAHKPILAAFPEHIGVEFSVGYEGNFAPFRVWESYAWMHTCYGAQASGPAAADGRWFDAVIPGSFDETEFPFFPVISEEYHLYVGRIIDRKGIDVAMEACKRAGKRLVIVGPQPHESWRPTWGEYIGELGPSERNRIMAGATALWVPTKYIEPFGNVAVEAMMCGTPVICTDWGAMTETVINGLTGYRCHTLEEFVKAADDVKLLNRPRIRAATVLRYGSYEIGQKYQLYFKRLMSLWGEGWYAAKIWNEQEDGQQQHPRVDDHGAPTETSGGDSAG